MTPRIGEEFVGWKPPTGGDEALGLVDFALFPHLDHDVDIVDAVLALRRSMPEGTVEKILWNNPARFYGVRS